MVAGQLDRKANEAPCNFPACKGLELLVRHFAGCKNRVSGGCTHCKRMWQILKLHSRICAESNLCKVPLCRYNPLAFVLFHSVVFYCVISSHTTKLWCFLCLLLPNTLFEVTIFALKRQINEWLMIPSNLSIHMRARAQARTCTLLYSGIAFRYTHLYPGTAFWIDT